MNFVQLSRALGLSLSSVLLMSNFAFAQMAPLTETDAPADAVVEPTDDSAATAVSEQAKTSAGSVHKVFVHDATIGNTGGSHVTQIDDPMLNGKPDAIIFATANFNPPGQSGVYNNHPIGVWYNGSKWTIYNQDFAPMPVGASFNVRVGDGFLHEANGPNIDFNWTTIDHPSTNNNPTARLSVTPNFSPGNAPGVYLNHNFGVWYTGSKWAIYNEDGAPMPDGVIFNVLVGEGFVHKAAPANINSHMTTINHPDANGKPDARLIVTRNWNPDGVGGTYSDHSFGVWYNGSRWIIYNQDISPMPNKAAFNVIVVNAPKITSIKIVGTKVVVFGENFTNGAVVMVNGFDLTTKNHALKPTTKLVCKNSANAFPIGTEVTVEVRNGDGLMSQEMKYTNQ
jgi:hypothetical protein